MSYGFRGVRILGGRQQLRVLVSRIRVIAEIFRVWHFLILALGCLDLCDFYISAAYNTQDARIINNTESHAVQAILHSCRGREIIREAKREA